MLEYHNNILCIQGGWLYKEAAVMSNNNYRRLTQRGNIRVVRRGCKGNPALVSWDSMPERFKELVVKQIGNPYELVERQNPLLKYIDPDGKAAEFFRSYQKENGDYLPSKRQIEYQTNAEVLNAIIKQKRFTDLKSSATGNRNKSFFEKVSLNVNKLDPDQYKHSLPTPLAKPTQTSKTLCR